MKLVGNPSILKKFLANFGGICVAVFLFVAAIVIGYSVSPFLISNATYGIIFGDKPDSVSILFPDLLIGVIIISGMLGALSGKSVSRSSWPPLFIGIVTSLFVSLVVASW